MGGGHKPKAYAFLMKISPGVWGVIGKVTASTFGASWQIGSYRGLDASTIPAKCLYYTKNLLHKLVFSIVLIAGSYLAMICSRIIRYPFWRWKMILCFCV